MDAPLDPAASCAEWQSYGTVVPATTALRAPRLRLRRASPGDVPALVAIRAEPSVRRWWGAVRKDDFKHPEDGEILAIEVDGAVAGVIQYDEIADPMYHSAAVDIFLGAEWQGRGLGREAVATLVRHLFEVRGHHRLTIDPALSNEPAIRCYSAVGFTRVGVMRQYERVDDGAWHDSLLMELLAADWPSVPGHA
jgi:aminoglycoside 6'-N-acetyltransferase